MRLIALWILGGPVLQMGGGSTKPGVTPEEWRRLQLLGWTKQRNQTVSLERGGWNLSFHPWDTGLAEKPKGLGCNSYGSLGKHQSPSYPERVRLDPSEPHSQGKSRAILFGILHGHESFQGVGKKWYGVLWGLTARPLSGGLHPKTS